MHKNDEERQMLRFLSYMIDGNNASSDAISVISGKNSNSVVNKH